jgi:predicted methyltransferase
MLRPMKKPLLAVILPCMLACATTPTPREAASPQGAPTASDYRALVEAPSRPEADRALDANRKPAELLAFYGVRPGMKVADLGAGFGYTTELLARAVGPTGVVYSHNPEGFLRFAEKPWAERLARPELKNAVRVVRDFADPLPPEARDLDLVVNHVVYHDTVWLNVDRDQMNRNILAALKPGGAYVVVDSSARPGTGVADAQTLHRIEEQTVMDEVQKAGFRLDARGDFLRNPADTRDWNTSPREASARRGTGDRFVLRFVKAK